VRRVRKLKSRDVVGCFECTCGKLCDKQHVFVSQNVCRRPSFSVWTRAWTRLVVDTLRGNIPVEQNTGNNVTSCIQTRPPMRKFACGYDHVSKNVT